MVNPEKKSGPDITNDIKSTGRESISNNISKIKFTEEESIPDIINGIKFTGKKSISTNISNIKSSEEEFIPNITNGIKSTGEETISDIISNVKSTEEDSVLDITNGIKSTEKGSDPFINNNVKSIEHESIPYMNSDLKSLEQESVPYITNDVKSTERPVRVAIIGGGIGGLCLALGLLKYSHLDVQVYEAASTFTEIGAGVALGLNAERALESIGPAAKQAMDKHASGNLTASRSMTSFEYKIVSDG